MFFFFFQAEDGIRDIGVTGVQTCALPIWRGRSGTHEAAASCRNGCAPDEACCSVGAAGLAGWWVMAQFLRLPMKHRSRPDDLPGVVGPARMDRRTKNLSKRLCPGDIAIIDHVDLDRVSADALIRR